MENTFIYVTAIIVSIVFIGAALIIAVIISRPKLPPAGTLSPEEKALRELESYHQQFKERHKGARGNHTQSYYKRLRTALTVYARERYDTTVRDVLPREVIEGKGAGGPAVELSNLFEQLNAMRGRRPQFEELDQAYGRAISFFQASSHDSSSEKIRPASGDRNEQHGAW